MTESFPVCPTCGGYIPNNREPGAYPGALSRKDNRTEICSACGTAEAMAGIPRDYSIGADEPSGVSAGWHLPAGDNVQPQPVLVPHSVKKLVALIGGGCKYLEAVNGGTINMDTGEVTYLIGFVDEDGFANQQIPNYLAMALFNNDQIIVGDCYVVAAVNPETLQADGEPHDIPDEITEHCLPNVVEVAAANYNWVVKMYSAAQVAIERGLLTRDDLVTINDDQDIEAAENIVRMLEEYADVVVTSMETPFDDLDDIIDNELKGMLDDQ